MNNRLKSFKTDFFTCFTHSPTNDQFEAINKISEFICEQNPNAVFILNGYAGTGKTKLIASLSKSLHNSGIRSVLMAPTGRAAKVLSEYASKEASTIHRKIYSSNLSPDGPEFLALAENLHKNTVFIVDEASMIGNEKSGQHGNSTLLEDVFEYVFSGDNCKLILVGDTAQLPPVGSSESPALDIAFLEKNFNLNISASSLKEVVRQEELSGILYNATQLRIHLVAETISFPKLELFPDVKRINGTELEDELNAAYSNYGFENTLIICRSNKRANAFNFAVRNRIKWQESEISAGDLMMVVKNNYFWLKEEKNGNFIANGENIEIRKIKKIKDLYEFKFAEAVISLSDQTNQPEIEAILLLDTITQETPSLSKESNQKLFHAILEDLDPELSLSSKKYNILNKNPYYNALQVKFSYAVTCHKSQGGQWPCVFIDQGYLNSEMMGKDYLRWLYTAFTRASEKVYLVNFNDDFFQ